MKNEIEIFKLKVEDEGKSFIIRPLCSPHEFHNILSYTIKFDNKNYTKRNLCFVVCNDELKIFQFGQLFKDILTDDMFNLLSKKGIRVDVGVVETLPGQQYVSPKFEIFEFDDSWDKIVFYNKYIGKLLSNHKLSLESAYSKEVESYMKKGIQVIRDMDTNEFKFKTLEEFIGI